MEKGLTVVACSMNSSTDPFKGKCGVPTLGWCLKRPLSCAEYQGQRERPDASQTYLTHPQIKTRAASKRIHPRPALRPQLNSLKNPKQRIIREQMAGYKLIVLKAGALIHSYKSIGAIHDRSHSIE